MKLSTLLLTTILIVQFTTAQSQDYIPLPSENTIWQNQLQFIDGGYFYSYCTAGDTSINEQNYTKIDSCGTGYKGAIRSENGKAFFVPADFSEEYLLYDFTLEEGETIDSVYFEFPGSNDFALGEFQAGIVDSVLIGGEYRKRISIEYYEWIEGVGCTSGLFKDPSVYFDIVLNLSCFSVNNSILYPEESDGESCPTDFIQSVSELFADEVKVFPNPAKDELNVVQPVILGDSQWSVKVYSSMGREIKVSTKSISTERVTIDVSAMPSGIYFLAIENGDKAIRTRFVKK